MVRNNQHVQHQFQSGRKEGQEVEHSLFSPEDRILVGVSGGADSVFLLRFLHLQKKWHLVLTAAHYNHGLRGEASDQEEAFVASLCKRWEVPLKRGRWEKSEAKEKVSEERAREARYAFFKKTCEEVGANKIALAHTRDDDVETILFRILRGSGLSGLRGIPYARSLGPYRIIRPLKNISREAIRRELHEKGIAWCEDASNSDVRYTRNRIRHTLLPLLEKEFNPNIREILVNLGKNASEDYDYLQKEGESAFQKVLLKQGRHQITFRRRMFQAFPVAIQKQLFRQAIRNLGANMDEIGYSDWKSVAELFARKSFQYTLPGPLYLRATPTKVVFAFPSEHSGMISCVSAGNLVY